MNDKLTKTTVLTALIIFSVSMVTAQAATVSPGGSGGGGDGNGGASATYNLNEGWNTVAFNVEGVTFDQIRENSQCDFRVFQGSSIYTQVAGDFRSVSSSEPLDPRRGYSIGVNSQECSFTVSGTEADFSSVQIEPGWNLINVPEGMSASDIWQSISQQQCSLQYFNYEEPVTSGPEWYFWIHKGGDTWEHPRNGEGSIDPNEGVYINPSETCSVESVESDGPGMGDGDTGSNDNSDGSDGEDNSGDSDSQSHTDGDLYFWDTQASTALVNSEAGSPDSSASMSYDMHDGNIRGTFTWHNQERADHKIWVKNLGNGETTARVDGSLYVKATLEGSWDWGTNVDGVRNIDGCTDFKVAILEPSSSPGDEVTQSEALQMSTFTFCPSTAGDSGDESDEGGDSSGSSPNPADGESCTDYSSQSDFEVESDGNLYICQYQADGTSYLWKNCGSSSNYDGVWSAWNSQYCDETGGGGDSGGSEDGGDSGGNIAENEPSSNIEWKLEPNSNWYDESGCSSSELNQGPYDYSQTIHTCSGSVNVNVIARTVDGKSLLETESGKKVRVQGDINNNGYHNNPGWFSTGRNECLGQEDRCSASHSHTVDGDSWASDSYHAKGRIQYRECSSRRQESCAAYNWVTIAEHVWWNIHDDQGDTINGWETSNGGD